MLSIVMTQILGIFNPIGSLLYTPTQSDWPLFLQKIINFLLDFQSFSLILDIFYPSFFTKPYIRLGPIFVHVLNPATEDLMKYPPPDLVLFNNLEYQ